MKKYSYGAHNRRKKVTIVEQHHSITLLEQNVHVSSEALDLKAFDQIRAIASSK